MAFLRGISILDKAVLVPCFRNMKIPILQKREWINLLNGVYPSQESNNIQDIVDNLKALPVKEAERIEQICQKAKFPQVISSIEEFREALEKMRKDKQAVDALRQQKICLKSAGADYNSTLDEFCKKSLTKFDLFIANHRELLDLIESDLTDIEKYQTLKQIDFKEILEKCWTDGQPNEIFSELQPLVNTLLKQYTDNAILEANSVFEKDISSLEKYKLLKLSLDAWEGLSELVLDEINKLLDRLNIIEEQDVVINRVEHFLRDCAPFIQEIAWEFLNEFITFYDFLRLSFEERTLRGEVQEHGVGFPTTCFEIYFGLQTMNVSINLPLLLAHKQVKYSFEDKTNQIFYSFDKANEEISALVLKDLQKAIERLTPKKLNKLERVVKKLATVFREYNMNDVALIILMLLAYKKGPSSKDPLGKHISCARLTKDNLESFIKEIVEFDDTQYSLFIKNFLPPVFEDKLLFIEQVLDTIDEADINEDTVLDALFSVMGKDLTWGQDCTPKAICELIPRLLNPNQHDTIFSPTLGIGTLERAMIKYASKDSHILPLLNAIELSSERVLANSLLNFIAGFNDFDNSDVLDVSTGNMLCFSISHYSQSCAVCTPPFGEKINPALISDKKYCFWGGQKYQPKTLEEFSLLQAYSALNNAGIMGIIVTNGLFTGRTSQKLVKYLFENDHIEAVINLPENTYPYTSTQTKLIIINKAKASNKKNKFIYITPDNLASNIDKIVSIYQAFQEIKDLSYVIYSAEMFERKDMNLNLYLNEKMFSNKKYTKLGELVKIVSGLHYNSKDIISSNDTDSFTDGSMIHFIRPRSITENKIDFKLDLSSHHEFIKRTKIIDQKCLLITDIGTNLKPVVFEPSKNNPSISISSSILALFPSEKISAEYLCLLFMTDKELIRQVESVRSAGVMPRITKGALGRVYINPGDLYNQEKAIEYQNNAIKNYKAELLEKEHIRHNQIISKLEEDKEAGDYEIAGAIAHNINNKILPLRHSMEEIKRYLEYKGMLNDFIKKGRLDTVQDNIEKCIKLCTDMSKLVKDAKSVLTEKINKSDFVECDLSAECRQFVNNHKSSTYTIKLLSSAKAFILLHRTSLIEALECMLNNAEVHAWTDTGMSPKDKVFSLRVESNIEDETVKLTCYNSGKPFPADYSKDDFLKLMNRASNSKGSGIGGAWVAKFIKAHNASFEINRLEGVKNGLSGTELIISFN